MVIKIRKATMQEAENQLWHDRFDYNLPGLLRGSPQVLFKSHENEKAHKCKPLTDI